MPAGWLKRSFPWEVSEVETQLNTKKLVFAEDSNLVFLYFSWVSTSEAHIAIERLTVAERDHKTGEKGGG